MARNGSRRDGLTRRELIRGSAAAGASFMGLAALAACTPQATEGAKQSGIPAQSPSATSKGSNKVYVAAGGLIESQRQFTWEPFEKETGIEIVPVLSTAARSLALVQAGAETLDVVSAGGDLMAQLQQLNALEKLDRSKFKLTDLSDISQVTDFSIAYNSFAVALAYNTKSFAAKRPASWADFWDTKTFPGRRTLQDAAVVKVDLEFALLADGVAMDKLYPLDIDRAFRKFKEIHPSILKYYTGGAAGADLFAQEQVVLGSMFPNRIWPLADGGAPLGVEWNQHIRVNEPLVILKNAPNKENAYRYIDYAMQPEVQAKSLLPLGVAPSNRKAYASIDAKTASRLPTSPDNVKLGFDMDVDWWFKNRATVVERWKRFLIEG